MPESGVTGVHSVGYLNARTWRNGRIFGGGACVPRRGRTGVHWVKVRPCPDVS